MLPLCPDIGKQICRDDGKSNCHVEDAKLIQAAARNAHLGAMNKQESLKRVYLSHARSPSFRTSCETGDWHATCLLVHLWNYSTITEVQVMLVLSRKVGEKVVIDGCITVTVVSVDGNKVRSGVTASRRKSASTGKKSTVSG